MEIFWTIESWDLIRWANLFRMEYRGGDHWKIYKHFFSWVSTQHSLNFGEGQELTSKMGEYADRCYNIFWWVGGMHFLLTHGQRYNNMINTTDWVTMHDTRGPCTNSSAGSSCSSSWSTSPWGWSTGSSWMKNRKRKNTEISFVLVFSVQIVHCDFLCWLCVLWI